MIKIFISLLHRLQYFFIAIFLLKIIWHGRFVISKITLQQHFWWLAPENSKNHLSQKFLKNQEPDRCYEIESKVKY